MIIKYVKITYIIKKTDWKNLRILKQVTKGLKLFKVKIRLYKKKVKSLINK